MKDLLLPIKQKPLNEGAIAAFVLLMDNQAGLSIRQMALALKKELSTIKQYMYALLEHGYVRRKLLKGKRQHYYHYKANVEI